MKAILLAAGKGTRISRSIEEVPKCTLPINGVPMIRRTVEMMIERNIEPIVCVGYCKEKIYEALKGIDVKYYYNPFYNITNSIASLWFAKDEFVEDTIIMNADVYIVDEILDCMISASKEAVLMIDKKRVEVGDFFLQTKNGYIQKYGKELPLAERDCEYVGVGKIGKTFLGAFKKRLELLISTQQHQMWWENILYSFVEEDDKKINILDVEGKFWGEIDYFDDYERILTHVGKRSEDATDNIKKKLI